MQASTPCTQCRTKIVVEVQSRDIRPAMTAAGAVWDRGWFCSLDCRDAFNLHAPSNGWDRAKLALQEKARQ